VNRGGRATLYAGGAVSRASLIGVGHDLARPSSVAPVHTSPTAISSRRLQTRQTTIGAGDQQERQKAVEQRVDVNRKKLVASSTTVAASAARHATSASTRSVVRDYTHQPIHT